MKLLGGLWTPWSIYCFVLSMVELYKRMCHKKRYSPKTVKNGNKAEERKKIIGVTEHKENWHIRNPFPHSRFLPMKTNLCTISYFFFLELCSSLCTKYIVWFVSCVYLDLGWVMGVSYTSSDNHYPSHCLGSCNVT